MARKVVQGGAKNLSALVVAGLTFVVLLLGFFGIDIPLLSGAIDPETGQVSGSILGYVTPIVGMIAALIYGNVDNGDNAE